MLTMDDEGRPVDPSPAAVAFVARLTQADWENVWLLAHKIDAVAEEARTNERKRIFGMSFLELMRELWRSQSLHRR